MSERGSVKAGKALERLRTICLALPEAEEKVSHGAPLFHVRNKSFAMFHDHHHGDGRIAVWCKASFEAQQALVSAEPGTFFLPPYVAHKGWVGVRLDRPKTAWDGVKAIVEDGWRMAAPKRLLK